MLFLILFILFFDTIAQDLTPKYSTPYGKNAAVGKYAKVNGINMYYEVYGSGKPMVMIHGNGGDIQSMAHQVDYFSKKYKVIVADSRAHGRSDEGGGRLTYEQMAADWAALLAELKVDSAYIFGWSDGGIIGLLMAIHHPQAVGKLAAMGANLQPDSSAVYPWAVILVQQMIKHFEVVGKSDTSKKARIQNKHFDLLGRQPNIPFPDLKKISSPVLIMAGDKDVIREEHTVSMYQHIKNAHLCILPGETHMTPVTDHNFFNILLERFFDKPFKRPDTKDFLLGGN